MNETKTETEIMRQFELFSILYESKLKEHADFKEAQTIYQQLKEVRVKLIEYERIRVEENIAKGLC